MLYDPLKKNFAFMSFEEVSPLSSYFSQTDSLALEDMPTKVVMQFNNGQLQSWMFKPLDDVVLGTCGPQPIIHDVEQQFNCDMPLLIFMLVLEGSCDIRFAQRPGINVYLEKNMFAWGDWTNIQGMSRIPKQAQYCHVSFSIKKDVFQKHFGAQVGEQMLTQLRNNSLKEGDAPYLSGLASPELLTTGRRLLGLPRKSQLDILALKATSLDFVSRMMRYTLDTLAGTSTSYSLQDLKSIRELKRRLETEIFSQVNVLELCSDIGMSRSKASCIFKQIYNTTIGKYNQACKMTYAYNMLVSRQLNVSECVYTLGYTNIGHFIDAFRRYYGYTPGEVLSMGQVSHPGD